MQKKRLLFFATGSDRVPIKGLSHLNFCIAKNGGDRQALSMAYSNNIYTVYNIENRGG